MGFKKLQSYIERLLNQPVVKTIIESTVVRGIGLSVAFFGQVYLARRLGPEIRGTYSAIVALVAIGAQVLSFGLQNTNTYVIAKDLSKFNRLFSLNIGFLLVLTLGGTVIAYPLWRYLSFPVENAGFSTSIYTLLLIIATIAFWLMGQLLLGLSQFRDFNLFELISKFVTVIAVCFLGFSGLLSLNSALLSSLLGLAIGGVFFAYSALKRMPTKFEFHFDLSFIFDQIGYSGRVYLSMIATLLLVKIDILIIERMLGGFSAGIYSVASSLCDLLLVLPSLIAAILFPKIRDSKTTEEAFQKVIKALRYYLVPLLLGITVFFFISGEIVRMLYGEDYAAAAAPMRILTWAAFFMSINNYFSVYLSCVGSPWSYVFTGFAISLLNLILNIYVAERWGIVGVAFVSLVTYFMATAINFFNSYRISLKKAAL
ncbi:oligosaccharide flippase family protein [Bdellovibrio sp. HCB117]|uniref:oligosaccharide flippase family protein n=1 Tax=Bdellovibrio sp. HCB117 TaxID=3394359 RepID=UPI0039B3FB0D